MIEILKETARYLVCVKPIGIAAQGTQAEAMPQLLSEQPSCSESSWAAAYSPSTGSTRRSAA